MLVKCTYHSFKNKSTDLPKFTTSLTFTKYLLPSGLSVKVRILLVDFSLAQEFKVSCIMFATKDLFLRLTPKPNAYIQKSNVKNVQKFKKKQM